MTAENLYPTNPNEVLDIVRWAAAEREPLEILGAGSKRNLGRTIQTAHQLQLTGLSGISLFEPEELVLTAAAGTPVAEIESALADHRQELQFEPMDPGPLLGQEAGQGTLGGLVSTNFAGPRRLKSGSARDHILGIEAVSGRGELFKSGGRVVKNVTGYDLSKGITGAWGTLAVLTSITMKVLPRAQTEQTLVLHGLDDQTAIQALAKAMGSSAEVSGAAHWPEGVDHEGARTFMRIEGFAPSVKYRIEKLQDLLGGLGSAGVLEEETSRIQWKSIRDCMPFSEHQDRPLWRISCAPMSGPALANMITATVDCRFVYDWQGGLIWLEVNGSSVADRVIRQAVFTNGGGHATLVRASAEQRRSVPVFQPQPKALAALSRRYRENFDPYSILNPGRMIGEVA